jgi:formate dehydrogenase iron-sulfur subunit
MSTSQPSNKMKGILTDVTRCIGCERCVEACVQVNKLPDDLPAHFKAGDGLSASRFTAIEKIAGKDEGSVAMVRRQCMHCIEPSCAAACLVGAFEKLPGGPVVYDASKCIGCRYCMLACPAHVIRYQWDTVMPFVQKCDLCYDREGGPACAEACPSDVSIYGERDELLKIAHERIRANPEKLEH